jgi:hypothetical protein
LFNLFPDKVDLKAVTLAKKMNVFEAIQNHNLSLSAAKKVGCKLVGIGAEDLRDGVLHLVFGLLWQIIKQGLLSKINITEHPELLELGLDQSELEKLSASHPEELLLRWVNFHLRNAGSSRVMTNFTQDVQDSEIYTTLLNHLAPNECSLQILEKKDLLERANAVLEAAELLDVRKFVSPGDIVAGNYKLNMAFVANLFDNAAQFERSSALARNQQLAKAAQDAAALAAQTAAAEARAKAAEDAARAAERAAREQAAQAAARAAEAERRRLALEQEAREREAVANEERQRLERLSSQRAAELAASAKKREDELKAQMAGLEESQAAAMRRALREREDIEAERNKLLERLEAAKIQETALRDEVADTSKQLAQLESALEEALAGRAAAEARATEDVAKTKAGARDWFAKQEAEKAKAIAAANAAAEAWQKKALDKEQLLKKYQEALKQAREQRDQAKDELVKATGNADAHHRSQLAEKDKQLEDMRAAALAMQARYEESLEAVRARAAAASSSSGDVETLKRQAMEALQHVQSQGAHQLDAQKRAYDAEIARLRQALAAASEAAAAAPRAGDGDDGKAKKRLRALEKRLASLVALGDPRQGFLVKYGETNKTWNKRMFRQVRNALVYYREDGEVGGLIDMDEAVIENPQKLGIASGTSTMTLGVNKPTAYEFIVSARGKLMRLCATDGEDEKLWIASIQKTAEAWKNLDQIIEEQRAAQQASERTFSFSDVNPSSGTAL